MFRSSHSPWCDHPNNRVYCVIFRTSRQTKDQQLKFDSARFLPCPSPLVIHNSVPYALGRNQTTAVDTASHNQPVSMGDATQAICLRSEVELLALRRRLQTRNGCRTGRIFSDSPWPSLEMNLGFPLLNVAMQITQVTQQRVTLVRVS